MRAKADSGEKRASNKRLLEWVYRFNGAELRTAAPPRPAPSCTSMGRREKTDFADLMKGEQESLPGSCNPVKKKKQHKK